MTKKRKDGCSPDEVMELTKVAKSWEFTCSFCFKKFPSAQAMGGHQNAHRSERLEEKRLFVRDPIGYRKRAFLRAIKADSSSSSPAPPDFNAGGSGEINAGFYQRWSSKDSSSLGNINAPNPKELSFHAENNEACIHLNLGINLDHNLDLTLKL